MAQQPCLADPGQASGEPPRVLVIAPDRVHVAVIARRLAERGFRIATARNAHDGLAELHRNPVDLILAELRLPGTSGVELVRMIREDSAHRYHPVLLIAGRTDRKGSVAGFEAGADGIVRKPFHFEYLAARIAREIERAKAIDKLRHDNAVLDARVISRAIELGEMRARFEASENARRRLELGRRQAA